MVLRAAWQAFCPLDISQMWMNVTGLIAASTAARTSWGVTAVAAPRASPHTPSGASVWVSSGGWEEADPPPESVQSGQLGTTPMAGCCDKHKYLKADCLVWKVVSSLLLGRLGS